MSISNIIMDNVMKKYDLSCSYINMFFLSNLYVDNDPQLYKNIMFDSEYIDNENIIILAKIYIKMKKIKNILSSFVRMYKFKKAILYDCNTDLYLNNLDNFQDKFKITLLENNTKYKFRLSNLVNYWVESLLNHEALFSKPICLKNPHTNLDISISNLYNIYFKLIDTGFTIPLPISAFFLCNMNIAVFSYRFYPMLKEKTIENFIKLPNNIYDKWDQVINMLHEYRKHIKYLTFTNFVSYNDKIIICKKLKDVLYEYLKFKFSCNPLIKKQANIKAKKMLKQYMRKNPYFGFDKDDPEVIEYIPISERPRVIPPPPPPPPPVVNINPILPSPPPPPIISNNEVINPFVTYRQLPRTPPATSNSSSSANVNIRNSLSLFRR